MKKISTVFLYIGLAIIFCGFLYDLLMTSYYHINEATGISLIIMLLASPFLAIWAVLKIIIDKKLHGSITFTSPSEKVQRRNKILSNIFLIFIGSLICLALYNSLV